MYISSVLGDFSRLNYYFSVVLVRLVLPVQRVTHQWTFWWFIVYAGVPFFPFFPLQEVVSPDLPKEDWNLRDEVQFKHANFSESCTVLPIEIFSYQMPGSVGKNFLSKIRATNCVIYWNWSRYETTSGHLRILVELRKAILSYLW